MASRRGAASRCTPPFIDPPGYARHRPEETLLYQLVEQHYSALRAAREAAGHPLPKHVQREFEAYLKCGRLEHGFLRVRCESCHAEKLVAFSCKGRAICPSCGARRMVETAALLVDEVLPSRPMRQWVLSLPFALRFLLARDSEVLTHVLGIAFLPRITRCALRSRLPAAAAAAAFDRRPITRRLFCLCSIIRAAIWLMRRASRLGSSPLALRQSQSDPWARTAS